MGFPRQLATRPVFGLVAKNYHFRAGKRALKGTFLDTCRGAETVAFCDALRQLFGGFGHLAVTLW